MQQKIQTFLNTCLRRIFNIRWPEKIRNEELWERAGQEPVAKQILRRKVDTETTTGRMGLARLLKGWILPQLLLGYIFIVSGLIVCSLMLLSCIVWPFDRHLYRKINVYLGYSFWSHLTFLAQWWSGTEVYLYIDPEAYRKLGTEHVLVLMNHKYDIDWLMTWILSERLGILGGCKFYGKESLRYLPLMGWAWYFTESIFLKRQWEHDRQIIARYIKRVLDFPKNYFSTILLCPEGTRFTEEKLKASQEVCRAKGYPLTKHTLLPRTKGFILSMHGMQGKVPAILDCTVAFPRDGPAPTLMNVINGVPMVAHFHCLRVPLEEVPIHTDEACGAWLRKQFKKKDELYDCFLKTGKFEGKPVIVPRRPHDLLMWRIFNIRWPEKIRNEELWEQAGQEPAAKQILRRKPGNYGTCGAGRVIIHIISSASGEPLS
nr:hypothetical protein BaRGS_007622 [Batillaria attramentaria]